ncbi:unnamed protein product [Sphagnum jensenii]
MIRVWTQPELTLGPMIGVNQQEINTSVSANSTIMEFVLFSAPSLIHGLLMTEVLGEARFNEPDVVRFFFGYKCRTCQEVHLVPQQVRCQDNLYEWMRHKCDPSELRRSIRRARQLGCSEDEFVVDNFRLTNRRQFVQDWMVETRNRDAD